MSKGIDIFKLDTLTALQHHLTKVSLLSNAIKILEYPVPSNSLASSKFTEPNPDPIEIVNLINEVLLDPYMESIKNIAFQVEKYQSEGEQDLSMVARQPGILTDKVKKGMAEVLVEAFDHQLPQLVASIFDVATKKVGPEAVTLTMLAPFINPKSFHLITGLEIDWDVLRAQKMSVFELIKWADRNNADTVKTNLTGLLHLLDGIQDMAVDKIGWEEEEVFGKEKPE